MPSSPSRSVDDDPDVEAYLLKAKDAALKSLRRQKLIKERKSQRRMRLGGATLQPLDEGYSVEVDATTTTTNGAHRGSTTTTPTVELGGTTTTTTPAGLKKNTMLQRVLTRDARDRARGVDETDPHLRFASVLRAGATRDDDAAAAVAAAGALDITSGGGQSTGLAGITSMLVDDRGCIVCGREDGVIVTYPPREGEGVGVGGGAVAAVAAERPNRKVSTPPPSAWNGGGGGVKLLKTFVARSPPEHGGGERRILLAAHDNGSWARYVHGRSGGDGGAAPAAGWILDAAAPGPHPDFCDIFKLRPTRERSRWAPRRACVPAACFSEDGDVLYISSPVIGESCVYRWEIPATGGEESSREAKKASTTGAAPAPATPARDAAPPPPPEDPSRPRESWELLKKSTWGVVTRVDHHTDKVMAIVNHPARGGVVTGGNDKRIVVWSDEKNGSPMRVVHETIAAGAIRAVAITSDGRRLFTAGSDRNVRMWDLPATPAADADADADAAGSGSGSVAAGGSPKTKTPGIVLLKSFAGGHDGFVTSLALVPNARAPTHVVSGSEGIPGGCYLVKGDGGVNVWRVVDGVRVDAATRQTLDITSCHVSADAADPDRAVGMLSASKDGTVVEWAFDWKRRGRDEERGREIIRWRGGFLGEGKR
ncbi:uncharacterized protein MICPUCDRAFT_60210 [Micromonas pusilla CCMP1545]|uniref:Predicted protein n=1 Tax=Micromonas pusilla (strain CCMP1545) TaxID=564608 RepID=C1MXM0_MICPC|nr:uncharacterized protein MICPUCDRAFT_60210 [Micromonas pusilla CCMP1545]EEH55484.1 predicted protein [Micromonas pusilla CCMP1545]|eukprot:XP_003060715.1 predicted protein [Micromonas pusilla CCMP1545]